MRTPKLLSSLFVSALAVGGWQILVSPVRAQIVPWARTGTDFNLGSNWTGGVVPGSSSTASFGGSANSSIQPTLSASATIGNLRFIDNTGSTGYVISGAPGTTLTLGASAATISLTSSFSSTIGHTIAVPVVFSGTSATVSTSLGVLVNSPGIAFSGSISGASLTSLTLDGRVALNGGSGYGGTTNLGSSGTASFTTIGQPNAFGTSVVSVSGAGHTLHSVYDFTGVNRVANAFTFSNSGVLSLDAPNLELGGDIALSGTTATVSMVRAGGGQAILSGVISGGTALVLTAGSGTISVTNLNTFTGDVTITGASNTGGVRVTTIGNAGVAGSLGTGGTILLGTSGRLVYTGTGETTNRAIQLTTSSGGAIESSGTGPLVLAGTISPQGLLRPLELGGNNTGPNRVAGAFINTVSDSIALVKSGVGLWLLPANSGAASVTINGGTLQVEGSGTLTAGNLTITGAGSTLDINSTTQTVGGTATINGGGILSTGGGGSLTATSYALMGAADISAVLAGPGSLTVSASGSSNATLSGLNTYQGKTTVGGSLSFNSIGNVGGGASALGAPVTVANGTVDLIGTLTYTGPAAATDRVINLAGTSTGGTISSMGSGPLIINSALSVTGAGAKSLVLTGSTQGNIFHGAIADGVDPIKVVVGANSFNPSAGSGSWTLNGNNTYTGGTEIGGGTLRLGSDTALGSPTAMLSMASATYSTLTLDLNGHSASVGRLEGFASARIANDASGTTAIFTVGNGVPASTINNLPVYTGLIADHTTGTGVLALNKVGDGMQQLLASTPNTYSGGTTVSSGTLFALGAQPLGTGPVTVSAGASLVFAPANNLATAPNSFAVHGQMNGLGTITGPVVLHSGGTLSPGDVYPHSTTAIGTLTVDSFTWNSGGKVTFDLFEPGLSDRLAITNAFTAGAGTAGDLVFDFKNTGGEGTFTLFTFGSLSGLTPGDISRFSATNLSSAYTGTFALTSSALLFTTAIPEPATYAAILGGVALLGAMCWRRRK